MDLSHSYASLVAQGRLEDDPAQRSCVARLEQLALALAAYQLPAQRGFLDRFFGLGHTSPPPRGVYIWGAVGRGKTMLMDLFFAGAPTLRKRRVHFHAFMADIHARIHVFRQHEAQAATRNGDPVIAVAADLAQEVTLLCLDECIVTNIADAMLLARLFTTLLAAGVIVVTTSNVAPRDLYKDGLNRALFLPFIDVLEQQLDVVELAARTDFRLEKLAGGPVFHVPADAAARRALDRAFLGLAGHAQGTPLALRVLGRTVMVPQAAQGVARFDFSDLCAQPLGAADYLAIAQDFHTVILDAVPVIAADTADIARRFITLVDTFYDHHVKLLMSADAAPRELFAQGSGREAFESRRTVSRLIEMQSRDYLGAAHGRRRGVDTSGIAET